MYYIALIEFSHKVKIIILLFTFATLQINVCYRHTTKYTCMDYIIHSHYNVILLGIMEYTTTTTERSTIIRPICFTSHTMFYKHIVSHYIHTTRSALGGVQNSCNPGTMHELRQCQPKIHIRFLFPWFPVTQIEAIYNSCQ